MKRNVFLWQLVGFSFTSFLGTILHFLYEWTGQSLLIAPFSGVNESTWEHMKLLYFPMFVFAVIQSFFFRDYSYFWCVKLRGILLGLAMIPALYYTYNGVIGKSPDWLNISIFFITAAAVFIYESRLLRKRNIGYGGCRVSFFMLCVIGVLFIVFTFFAPKIGIFLDPLTQTYGIR